MAAFLAWLLCSALYFWTASGGRVLDAAGHSWPHYTYLVDGFLSGHTHLSISPPPELLALSDPRDPAANQAHRLHDASLFRGRYYLYFGPTPALLLLLPWRVITGAHLPLWIGVGVFASAGLLALAALVTSLRRHCFPGVGAWGVFCTVVLAGHASWLPVLVRRPGLWELPIVAAQALTWLALACLWQFHRSPGRLRWALAGGVALACAIGARPTYVFAAGVIVLLFAVRPRTADRRLHDWKRPLLFAAVPVAGAVMSWLLYNHARFDSFLEFGVRHQLTGLDERQTQYFSPRYFSFHSWLYIFSLPELSVYFPFVRTVWPSDAPAGHLTIDEMHGVVFALPVLVIGLQAIRELSRRKSDATGHAVRMLLLGGALSTMLAAALLFCFVAACSRYIAELLCGWTVVVAAGALVLMGEAARFHRWRMAAVVVLGVWSCAYVWLASFEHHGLARATHPRAYAAAARALNRPSHYWAKGADQEYGPVVMDIGFDSGARHDGAVLLAAGRIGMLNRLELVRVKPGFVAVRFVANDQVVLQTPELAVAGPQLRVICRAPWLYPPREHPFWDQFPERTRQIRQVFFSIETAGQSYSLLSDHVFDSTRHEPFVRGKAGAGSSFAWVEHWSRTAERSDVEVQLTSALRSKK